MLPMRANSPSARSSNAEASQSQPAHQSQAPSAGMSAAQASTPVTSRSVVRWLGVTPDPTNGRTSRRARRCVQDVPITTSLPVRSGGNPRPSPGTVDQPSGFDDLPRDQRRDPQRDLAYAFEERQLDRYLWADAEQPARDDEAAFLYPERTRDGKADCAKCLPQTLDDQALAEIDRHPEEVEREHDL